MEEKVVKGKVVYKEGKYMLEVAGELKALPVGLLADEGFLKEQVGHEVEVFYSLPKSFVVVIKPIGRPGMITCNIPAPEFLAGSNTFITQPTPAMTLKVATALLKEGYITQAVYEKIVQSKG